MSSNSKEINSKAGKISEGKKDSHPSLAATMAEVKSKQSALPDHQNYSKKYRAEKVSDKSGWSVNPENKAILGGK